MISMDVFKDDAFSAISMTTAINKRGFTPQTLSTLPGLIVPRPVRTTGIFIEERDRGPALIRTTPRGGPPEQGRPQSRSARSFETVRIAKSATIHSHELQNMRPFGEETGLQTVQAEIAIRQGDLLDDYALTKEHMLLGLVQGRAVDADGSVIYDWAEQFGQTRIPNVEFAFGTAATGAIRKQLNELVREITRRLKGVGGSAVRIHAIVGDLFWDTLVNDSEVEKTYLNYEAAASLRGNDLGPWMSFSYGGVTFHNYRGTDDGTTVAVADDEAHFFPVGAGIFQWAMAPAEPFEFVNTLGRELYSWMVLDKDRNSWAKPELYSYPLPVCTMPGCLATGAIG